MCIRDRSKSFAVLFPGMLTALIFGIIGFVFQRFTGQYVPDFITATLQAPDVYKRQD